MPDLLGIGKILGLLPVLFASVHCQREIIPPTFNIAINRKVTVNATCGQGVSQKEVYCRLVGFDKYDEGLNERYDILDGQVCDYCYPWTGNVTTDKSHPGINVVDGDSSTWWQSPPISRGLKYNRITLSIDMQQLFQVAYIYITMANSPRPGVWALERSIDHGATWQPWQYFAGNDAECQKFFGIHANEKISYDEQVICSTEFSKIIPIEGGEILVSLTTGRPSAKSLFSNDVLQNWIQATNIRLRLIQTKTMLGHLMSVAQGDKTVSRRYYYSIKEISIGGRCVCNGHAWICPPSLEDPDRLECQCQHNTGGIYCDRCADGFTQKKWRKRTAADPFVCEPCNCHGHSYKCHYNETVDANRLSLDIHNSYEGGGVCEECTRYTDGINCETCIAGFFRPLGILPNDTQPCVPCQCGNDHRYTGNCAAENGQCECKPAFRGAPDCSACAEGYYDYPECKPCDCFANGTVLMDNGLPFCVAEGVLQCPCLDNFAGEYCNRCADGFYDFPKCLTCECESLGSLNQICNKDNGQCSCHSNYGSRRCDQCHHGYYAYPSCMDCDCDIQGTIEDICDKENGVCMCKDGFGGERCDRCLPGWYDYPNCKECTCSEVGSDSPVCDQESGQCPCYNNYGGRQCQDCSPGYFNYPNCDDCQCDSLGSRGVSCDDNGVCYCLGNFIGNKCDKCAPQRYNYPLCEECNCNPDGVTQDFFAMGGCESAPAGTLCRCKERVTGRICDTCGQLYWNLQMWNPVGCEDCECQSEGTIGSVGACDNYDGQCACKPNVGGTRKCDECHDGYYGLKAENPLGCEYCDCDVGGTQLRRGEDPLCDKRSGQCSCRAGLVGRRCDEVQDTYYVPTLHQFQYEIEDGYRGDRSPVRIGHDENIFPEYSWRGYGSFSPLQDEVLQDVPVTSRSIYRMVFRYMNNNPEPIIGEVTMHPGQHRHVEELTGEPQSHKVLFQPTGGRPAFVTVSGERDNYASPFDLEPGTWTTAVKIKNEEPDSQEILVDYFVLVPNEYYEPSILKQEVHNPCLAGVESEYCKFYAYPSLEDFSSQNAEGAQRPGGGNDIYSWSDDPDILKELGVNKLASLAKWQPHIIMGMPVKKNQKNVFLLSFFTPKGSNGSRVLVDAQDYERKDPPQSGIIDIYNCTFNHLCRQVVINEDGSIAEFDFNSDYVQVDLKLNDTEDEIAVDSLSAIPISEWSLDYVTPASQCIKKNGECLPFIYSDPPDGTELVTFNEMDDFNPPRNIYDDTKPLFFVDGDVPIRDIQGRVSQPGPHIFVAHFNQPDNPKTDLKVNISYGQPGEDIPTLLQNGQYYEAVLPLKNCPSNTGCRSVMVKSDDGDRHFNIPDYFNIALKNPDGKKVWLENVMAIPSYSYDEGFLMPQKVDKSVQFARECGKNSFYIDPKDEGFCKNAVISTSADLNGGALDCECDSRGSVHAICDKIGGQCPCRDNVIGRQCTRCKPGFYGYPDCKQCNCPPTAQCDEQTGECICAPRVTGTPDNPCSVCEENTFGYNPITGCQDCMCQTSGTVNQNMSCSLETGNCQCKDNIDGRTCDHCVSGYYSYPYCDQCPCLLTGTTQDICNQETSECLCKSNVEGALCDVCKPGSFDLKEINPDGCTECFCFGKTSFCSSKPNMKRHVINDMNNWSLSSLNFDKDVEEKTILQDDYLPNYGSEISVGSLSNYEEDLLTSTLYFKSPPSFSVNHLKSYAGRLKYKITYSGYELEGVPKSPDVVIKGNEFHLLYHSGVKVTPNEPINMEIPLEPRFWFLPTGAPAERAMLMSALKNVKAIFIKLNYGLDSNGQARLANVELDTAIQTDGENMEEGIKVTSIEKCECPEGYFGDSCEDCDVGYFRMSEGPLGPICIPCNCHGHSDQCHPITGECVNLTPQEIHHPQALQAYPNICHFKPELCTTSNETCLHNTMGPNCEKCDVGFFGDATRGSPHDCQPCPCPLQDNNFAISCDGLMNSPQDSNYCVCQPNYFGDRCQFCGPGHYGQPDVVGDYCKPCQCNGNIDEKDPNACDKFSGMCQKCLFNSYGADCSICEPWYYGDAVDLKNCRKCDCNQIGTERCDHESGVCQCFPGVEGEQCDSCMAEHWGFDSGENGCSKCDCSEASYDKQCDLKTGKCQCMPGVTGQKCDRCQNGYWNLGPNGCENCGCNTEFAVGGTCDQETGQCECLEGVIGQNCDHCPTHWILVVNENRTEIPEWKRPFEYSEGCFPCSSCVSDLMTQADSLNNSLSPIMSEFRGVESSFFAYKKLNFIKDEMLRVQPEIELLNPLESSRRLEPLEQALAEHDKKVRSLNIEYKENVMSNLKNESQELEDMAHDSVQMIDKARRDIDSVTRDMQKIADGLGSGVTPKQLESAVALGMNWMDSMKIYNFSKERQLALQEQSAARDLVNQVKDFISPVEELKDNVKKTQESIKVLEDKLGDLKNSSENSMNMLHVVERLNFRNAEPPASTKKSRILSMKKDAESSTELGTRLIDESRDFLKEGMVSYDELPSKVTTLYELHDSFENEIDDSRNAINENNANNLGEVQKHAYDLQAQADGLQDVIDSVKTPGNRTLEAANAYEKIVDSINVANDKVQSASEDSSNAASMSAGVGNKASQSKDRTQELYSLALEAENYIANELNPQLTRSKNMVEEADEKTKATKQGLEVVSKALEVLPDLTNQLETSAKDAEDAETLSHDALASIDARADEISRDMTSAKNLQDNYAEMRISIEATKKALDDLENKRSKRSLPNNDNVMERIERLIDRGNNINRLSNNVTDMIKKLKARALDVRASLSSIDRPGITFQQSSYLELKVPNDIKSEALNTKVSFYFNVTRRTNGDERAFIFYIGNVLDTHVKMPRASTDDYMAIEVVTGGTVKTTIDMGAGRVEVLSNKVIEYGEWHYLELERLEHSVTMILKNDEKGDIFEDIVRASLPTSDQFQRPFGSVFNLHPQYSKIFVGGFPNQAGIQDSVRETYMEGQIEGLKIGEENMGLWNYISAKNIRGAMQRNRFKSKDSQGLKFQGDGFVALDKYNFVPLESEFDITLDFKPEKPDGIILLMGSASDQDFVCLELVNGALTYRYNLGSGAVQLVTKDKYDLNVWHNVNIRRNMQEGIFYVNGEFIGNMESAGGMDELTIEDYIYLGGHPSYNQYQMVASGNFSGCIKEVFIGLDRADLGIAIEKANVKPGCPTQKQDLVSFLSSMPGYMQLQDIELMDRIHISFMFRTNQPRGLLLYMQDIDLFYYLSLSFSEGALSLRVFPRYETETSEKGSGKPIMYNDNEWHVVYISVTQSGILMHIDDYEFFELSIQNQNEMLLLNKQYNVFFGGIPESSSPMPGSIASNTPFIGCIRDVVLENKLYDFNNLAYHTGVKQGQCIIETVVAPEEPAEPPSTTNEEVISPANISETENEVEPENEDGEEVEELESESEWGFKELVPEEPPEVYGECRLPLSPSPDSNLTIDSGMRFGSRRDTYLEFHRKLKIKKRSEFKIDLRTSAEDGVILYIANERNIDFIALFMKKGKIVYGFNCGSGSTYIQTDESYNDDRWHHVEFKRQGNRGKLYVDNVLMGEKMAEGGTLNLDVLPEFFLGGIKSELRELLPVQRNLMRVTSGFIGCLRKFIHRRKRIGKWSKNHRNGVLGCSDMVEPGNFFGTKGGHIVVQPRYRVGMDFDVSMEIKPRNISGILLAIQGRKDYLILQMIDGALQFTADNGRGPINCSFKPASKYSLCDGKWHQVHAVKAKNVVTVSVDGLFSPAAIGVPGVSSTDTNHGLYIGGHPKKRRLRGLATNSDYVGCMKEIFIENNRLQITPEMVSGDIMLHSCPSI